MDECVIGLHPATDVPVSVQLSRMSLASHGRLLGAVLFVGAFFVAYGVSEALGGVVPTYARSIGSLTAAVVVAGVDLGLRYRWGEGDDWLRYASPGRGPHVSFLPAWVASVFFVLVAFAVVDR